MPSDSDSTSSKSSVPPKADASPDYHQPLLPIAEVLIDPGFPKSALGKFVDIGGYTGVVVELVKESLKVRSAEGITKGFNANGLRRIYGPVVRPDPPPPLPESPAPVRESRPAPPPVFKVEPTIEPDFGKPVVKIAEFIGRSDYPKCLLGAHVEIGDYVGVVIQIVNRSLKVRSQAETTRSYNADALRKLYT